MAIRNDPRMFTGGAVVFDSSPTVAFAAQQEAKRQAKEEALNKYFEDQLKQLNTEGIRQVDLYDREGKGRGIIDKINSWQQYWKENKNQILKGGMGRMDSDRMLQEIRQQIGEAKAAGKFFNDLGQAKFEGKYDPDDDELNVLHLASLPVYDPASRKQDGSRYGWSDLMPTIPEYDAKKQADVWSAITKGLQPGKVYDYNNLKINEKTGQAIVPFSEKYSLEQIKSIADNAASIAMSDKSVKKHFQKILNNPNSQEWQKLNSAYQSVYGKDKFVSEPWQAAQADAILRASVPQKVGQEQEVNYAQRLADKKMMAAFTSALIASRGGGNNETGKTTGNVFDDFPDTDFGKMKVVKGVWYNADGSPKTGKVYLKGELIPSSVRSVLKAGGIDEKALNAGVTANLSNGQIESVSNKGIGTVTRKAMEGVYQPKFDTERKGENINFPGGGGSANTVSINDVPPGTKLQSKNGKYYYKGKEVIQ